MALPKVKSATEFRADMYKTLKQVGEGKLTLVTQKTGDNVVLIAQKDFDAMLYERHVLQAISLGVQDFDAGRTVGHNEVAATLRTRRAKWK